MPNLVYPKQMKQFIGCKNFEKALSMYLEMTPFNLHLCHLKVVAGNLCISLGLKESFLGWFTGLVVLVQESLVQPWLL